MTGTIDVLNTGMGEMKITFDTNDTGETIRAKRAITDMLRRGYALVVEKEGKHVQVTDFDAAKGEYIIVDFDPESGGKKRVSMDTPATAIAPSAGG